MEDLAEAEKRLREEPAAVDEWGEAEGGHDEGDGVGVLRRSVLRDDAEDLDCEYALSETQRLSCSSGWSWRGRGLGTRCGGGARP